MEQIDDRELAALLTSSGPWAHLRFGVIWRHNAQARLMPPE